MVYGIDFMVFCYQDGDEDKEEMGIKVPLKDCELKLYTFFSVEWITSDLENENYTLIGCNGYEFVVNERYEVVKHKVQQANLLRFN